jgi:hypothetical protein
MLERQYPLVGSGAHPVTNDDQNWIAKYRAAIVGTTPIEQSWLEALAAQVKAKIQELASAIRRISQKKPLQRWFPLRTRNLDSIRRRKFGVSNVKSGYRKQSRAS